MTTVNSWSPFPAFLSLRARHEIRRWKPTFDLDPGRDVVVAGWRSWRDAHEHDGRVGVEGFIPPGFDPYSGAFGFYPTLHAGSLPVLNVGATGSYVAYMQGVLYWKANQPCRPQPLHLAASWGYGPVTRNCVIAFKRFFGIIPSWSTNSTVDSATWSAVQYCALYL